ncbi:hypothetical protein D3C78_1150800 [compost metagenome]
MDLLQLLHQLLVNMEATSRIDNDIVIAVLLRVLQTGTGNFNRRGLVTQREHGRVYLISEHLQLLNRCRTINITSDKQRLMVALLEQLSQLTGSCRLTGTLQAGHHNDGRRLIGFCQLALRTAHQLGQLFVYNIDDDHAGRKALGYV